jgi:hypothetical protein
MPTLLAAAVLLVAGTAQAACYGEWEAPEAPRYTDDVFDVYSQAPGAGLNGQPLREW